MQLCLRQLWFSAAVFDFELQARHIPGDHIVLADAFSADAFSDVRLQFRQSLHLSASATRLSPVSNSVTFVLFFFF